MVWYGMARATPHCRVLPLCTFYMIAQPPPVYYETVMTTTATAFPLNTLNVFINKLMSVAHR